MELEIKLTVKIEWNDEDRGDPVVGDPFEARMIASAKTAIKNALTMGEDGGFSHDLADITSVSILEVDTPIRVSDLTEDSTL